MLGLPVSRLAPAFASILLLAGCATQRADAVVASGPGFLLGLWHGFIFPVAWVTQLFSDRRRGIRRAQ